MACRAPKPLSGRSIDVQRRGHTALFVGLCGPEMADRRRFGHFQLCIHHRHPFGRHHPRQRFGFRGSRLGPTGLLGQYHGGLDLVGGRWCTCRGCGHVALKWAAYFKQCGLVDRAHFVQSFGGCMGHLQCVTSEFGLNGHDVSQQNHLHQLC